MGLLKDFPLYSLTNVSIMSKKAGVLIGKVVLKKSLVPRMSCDERTEGIKMPSCQLKV